MLLAKQAWQVIESQLNPGNTGASINGALEGLPWPRPHLLDSSCAFDCLLCWEDWDPIKAVINAKVSLDPSFSARMS